MEVRRRAHAAPARSPPGKWMPAARVNRRITRPAIGHGTGPTSRPAAIGRTGSTSAPGRDRRKGFGPATFGRDCHPPSYEHRSADVHAGTSRGGTARAREKPDDRRRLCMRGCPVLRLSVDSGEPQADTSVQVPGSQVDAELEPHADLGDGQESASHSCPGVSLTTRPGGVVGTRYVVSQSRGERSSTPPIRSCSATRVSRAQSAIGGGESVHGQVEQPFGLVPLFRSAGGQSYAREARE